MNSESEFLDRLPVQNLQYMQILINKICNSRSIKTFKSFLLFRMGHALLRWFFWLFIPNPEFITLDFFLICFFLHIAIYDYLSSYISISANFQSAVLWPKPSQGRCTAQSPSHNSSKLSISIKNCLSVKSVEVDLSGFSFRLFSFVQLCSFESYGSKFL